jgi:hypothetical protein
MVVTTQKSFLFAKKKSNLIKISFKHFPSTIVSVKEVELEVQFFWYKYKI